MAITQRQYRIASKRSGVPVALLKLVIGRESGGRQGARSPVGASGVAQLMPSTAAYESRKHKINTSTSMGNLLGGAYYLAEQIKAFGSVRLGLAAYNAGPNAVKQYDGVPPYHETQDYVSSIMQQYRKYAKMGAPATRAGTSIRGALPPSLNPAKVDTKALALEGLQHLSEGSYDPVQQLQALHEAMLASSQQMKSISHEAGMSLPTQGDWHKYVILSKGADRQGVHTSPEVLQFVGSLGMRMKRKLAIGTGTNHNQYVVGTQRESDHWTGHAADIPARGKQLTRLGRQALIAAGMPAAEARKAKGGVYNVGRFQIIFNTNEGGDHFNHLHVGVRGGK